MRKVSVIVITATYLDMTFATTANITSVVETGGYFVRTVICTIIWASFPMSHVDDMRGDRMRLIDADTLVEILTTAIMNMQGVAKFIGAEDDPEIKMEIKAYTDILEGVKEQPTIEPKCEECRYLNQILLDDGK